MVKTGTIKGNAKANGSITSYYSYWAEWTQNSYNIEDNTSNITVTQKIQCTANANSAFNLHVYPSVSLSVNGEAKQPAVNYIDTRNNVVCVIATWTGDVKHKDDGSLSCPISASFTHYGSSTLDGGSLYGNAELETIPRASKLISVADVILGNKCSVTWLPMVESFRYKLKFAIEDWNYWSYTTEIIYPNTKAEYTYTGFVIPLDVAQQIPDSKTATMTVYLYTYSDKGATEQVGNADSKTITVTVPDNDETKPEVSMSLIPVSSFGQVFSDVFIQGKSKVQASFTTKGKFGATIKSCSMKIEGETYAEEDDYTSDFLSNYGSFTVQGYATDSRDHTGSTSENIEVLAYSKPKISLSVCGRCDAEGNLTDSGTYLKIKASRAYSTLTSEGVQRNFCQIRFRYKLASAEKYSDWETILDKNSLSSDQVETGALLGGVLSVESTYHIQVQAIDDVGEYADTYPIIPTAVVHNHKTKNGWGFGKYCEGENLLDCAWDAHFHGDILLGEDGITLKDYILSVMNGGE